MVRSGARRAGLLLAATLAVIALPSTIAPVSAVSGGGEADQRAAGGRLIVFWRGSAPAAIALPGVVRTSRGPTARRSVVVAGPGSVASVATHLRADPQVVAVVPDMGVAAADWPASGSPNDPLYSADQPDLPLIGAPDAWRTTTGSASVSVAVLDSGIDRASPTSPGST